MDKKITRMNEHYIICGNGRIGSLISQELQNSGKEFVVIDKDPETSIELEGKNMPFIIGDATNENVLERARISRAKGLIATASSDVANVYISLIARALNPQIFILARAETEDSVKNLELAGANKVISPYLIGGRHMANIILKPTVVDFVELATGDKSGDFFIQMEGFPIREKSVLVGTKLKDSPIRKDLGLIVVAIKDEKGNMVFNPPAEYTLIQNNVLVCIGDAAALKSMKKLVGG